MPVTYVSYMVDASLCQATGIPLMGWMHLGNVFLHAMNFILLCMLLRRFLERGSAGILICALLWAVHPLRAEPVAWIAARKELLWTLFTLSGLIFWCAALRLEDGRRRVHMLLAYAFCALACLSKPTAMCFPALALLLEWYHRRGFRIQACGRLVLRYLPLVAMAGATAAIAAYSQTHVAGQGTSSLYSGTLLQRLVNAISSLGFYARATFWPFGLHVDCRAVNGLWPLDAEWNFAALALLAVGAAMFCPLSKKVLTVVGKAFDRGRVFFSVGWFLLSVLPTLGLLGSFGFEAHADRFIYLPSMAFAFLAARVLSGHWRAAVRNAAIALTVMLAAVTFRQLGFWRDDDTAHQRALACDPVHPRAMVHVADAFCSRRHDFDNGIALYREAIVCSTNVPGGGFDMADVKARLAYALASRGRHEDFSEVRSLGVDVLREPRLDRRGMMLDALGTAFMYEGEGRRAILLFQASIDAPSRFWPKASTRRKLAECQERIK